MRIRLTSSQATFERPVRFLDAAQLDCGLSYGPRWFRMAGAGWPGAVLKILIEISGPARTDPGCEANRARVRHAQTRMSGQDGRAQPMPTSSRGRVRTPPSPPARATASAAGCAVPRRPSNLRIHRPGKDSHAW